MSMVGSGLTTWPCSSIKQDFWTKKQPKPNQHVFQHVQNMCFNQWSFQTQDVASATILPSSWHILSLSLSLSLFYIYLSLISLAYNILSKVQQNMPFENYSSMFNQTIIRTKVLCFPICCPKKQSIKGRQQRVWIGTGHCLDWTLSWLGIVSIGRCLDWTKETLRCEEETKECPIYFNF